jgi:hypothetical protein
LRSRRQQRGHLSAASRERIQNRRRRRERLKLPVETEWVRLSRPLHSLTALVLIFCAGCHTAKPLPPADFSAPGWRVQQGQAVWKSLTGRPELAGDLLLATNLNGDFLIQFSKMPFPLATAQVAGGQWQIEFGADQYSWHGRGTPPNRFAWFQLPGALRDAKVGGSWQFTRVESNSWRLENSRTGEALEGEFFP